MKKLLSVLLVFISSQVFCQSHNDTIRLLQQTASLYDLDFTNAEADSMMDNIVYWKSIYVSMHKQLPKNELAFPFAFNPAPPGMKVPENQKPINWNIPNNVSLRQNKNDLAFYSITQLASLIK